MKIDSDRIVSVTEANRNFSKVARLVDRNGEIVDVDSDAYFELTDDEKINIVAARILKRYKPAFMELAK